MPNNASLTIENFDFEKLRAKAFESKKSGEFTYFAIPFDYYGGILSEKSREVLEYLEVICPRTCILLSLEIGISHIPRCYGDLVTMATTVLCK